MAACVLVRLADDPCRCIADAEVKDFSLMHQIVEAEHELGDAGSEIPPVDIKDVNIFCFQLP